jgi:uncharacterized SAM-binding protein YcdF (DUF218 family)
MNIAISPKINRPLLPQYKSTNTSNTFKIIIVYILRRKVLFLGVIVCLMMMVIISTLYLNSSVPEPFRYHFNVPDSNSTLQELIIVPGHSVYTSNNYSDVANPENWVLLPYQNYKGVTKTFLGHIKKGIEFAERNSQSVLIFSGGKTRSIGQMSEAISYWNVARSQNWLDNVSNRIILEEFALDSYENLLFSICRFKEFTGTYPKRITIVGYGFKRNRFENLHAKAIEYPQEAFKYVSYPLVLPNEENIIKGEYNNAFKHFESDPHGCFSPLADKKKSRNPFRTFHGYFQSCPEITSLLNYCTTHKRFTVPWK